MFKSTWCEETNSAVKKYLSRSSCNEVTSLLSAGLSWITAAGYLIMADYIMCHCCTTRQRKKAWKSFKPMKLGLERFGLFKLGTWIFRLANNHLTGLHVCTGHLLTFILHQRGARTSDASRRYTQANRAPQILTKNWITAAEGFFFWPRSQDAKLYADLNP